MIAAGDADIVVAGGMESMTSAPHLLLGARQGYRLGDSDAARRRSCTTASKMPTAMRPWASTASSTSRSSRRSPANARMLFAAASHERAARATKDGLLATEIIPVEVPQRRGEPLLVETDEGIRPGTTAESLSALRAAFAKDGTITAGNASQISDGASAVVVMSEAAAERHGVEPLGRVVSYGMVAGPDTCLMTQPSRSTRKALEKGRAGGRRRGRVRVQRGLRRGGPRIDRRSRVSPSTSSIPTAAPSPSATRLGRPATGWR